MTDNLTKTAPEKIYLWSEHTEGRDETFMGGNWSTVQHEDYESVEYVRADLVPTWKPLPDCVGQWFFEAPNVACMRIHPWHIDADAMKAHKYLLPAGGRWFGPMPEDK